MRFCHDTSKILIRVVANMQNILHTTHGPRVVRFMAHSVDVECLQLPDSEFESVCTQLDSKNFTV